MQWIWCRSSLRGYAAASLLAIAGLWLASHAESQPPRPAAAGVLSVLKVRQPLAVKDVGGRYELSLMPDADRLGHEVVEVGADYVVVRDTNDIGEIRIPIYSIKSITAVQRIR
jgi:hypothetical protein